MSGHETTSDALDSSTDGTTDGTTARGRFIVVEGVDGAGTTTQSRTLAAALEQLGHRAHVTQEPSVGPVGALLRQVLQGRVVTPNSGGRALDSTTMALLFAADRTDHVATELLPALRAGVTVICDRYDYSSVAYQSVTGDRSPELVAWLREINRRALRPDLTLVLDVRPEVAAARRDSRRSREIYEQDALQAELIRFYADIERHFPGEPIVHVDSNQPAEQVAATLLGHVRALLA